MNRQSRTGARASGLAVAVARYLFKLMAYKDEYEVARLYTNGDFHKQVATSWGAQFPAFIPPRAADLGATDPKTGEPRKIEFGPCMMTAFRLLARLKFLRGTVRHLRLFRSGSSNSS